MSIARKPARRGVDAWIGALREPRTSNYPPTGFVRLTVNVPAELRTRIKVDCARRGAVMAEDIRELLEKEWPPE